METTRCKATIVFGLLGDDYMEANCTFHCELAPRHKGPHQETGTLPGMSYEQPYILTWERKRAKRDGFAEAAEAELRWDRDRTHGQG